MTQRAFSLPIGGMYCAGYEAVGTTAVKELPGVETVNTDHRANKMKVRFDGALVSPLYNPCLYRKQRGIARGSG
jgi:copper chaperone CopZ